MISTAANIIGLTTLLSGVHCHFLNHPNDGKVEIKYGDHNLGDQFVFTSDKMAGQLHVRVQQESIRITYEFEGCTYYSDEYDDFSAEKRKLMRSTCIDILNGTVVIE